MNIVGKPIQFQNGSPDLFKSYAGISTSDYFIILINNNLKMTNSGLRYFTLDDDPRFLKAIKSCKISISIIQDNPPASPGNRFGIQKNDTVTSYNFSGNGEISRCHITLDILKNDIISFLFYNSQQLATSVFLFVCLIE